MLKVVRVGIIGGRIAKAAEIPRVVGCEDSYVGSIDCQGFVFQILAHCCTTLEKPAYSCDLNYMIEICGNGVV